MARLSIKQESLTLTSAVLAKLAEDQPIRQELAGRRATAVRPAIAVRVCLSPPNRRSDAENDGTEQLLESESASLILPASPRGAQIGAICCERSSRIWPGISVRSWCSKSGQSEATSPKKAALKNGQMPRGPKFEIIAPTNRAPRRTVEALAKALSKMRLMRGKAQVVVTNDDSPCPAWCQVAATLGGARCDE